MESINPFVENLRQRMVFEKPSSGELKNMLNSKIGELNNFDDKVRLLKEVYKLWQSPVIDIYYKGGIIDFFDYVNFRIKDFLIEIAMKKDWSGLFRDINGKYIKDVSPEDFNEVMNYKSLFNGKSKIRWLAKKTEAVYFQKEIGFTMAQFNDCFMWKDGSNFAEKNRHNTNPDQILIDIVAKHKHQ